MQASSAPAPLRYTVESKINSLLCGDPHGDMPDETTPLLPDGGGAPVSGRPAFNPAGKRVIVSTVILITLGGLVVLAGVFFCNNKNVVDKQTGTDLR